MSHNVRVKLPKSGYQWTEEEVRFIKEHDDGIDWNVDAIIDHEFRAGSLFYRVKWSGEWEPTYEPMENLDCEELLDRYHAKIGRDPRTANY